MVQAQQQGFYLHCIQKASVHYVEFRPQTLSVHSHYAAWAWLRSSNSPTRLYSRSDSGAHTGSCVSKVKESRRVRDLCFHHHGNGFPLPFSSQKSPRQQGCYEIENKPISDEMRSPRKSQMAGYPDGLPDATGSSGAAVSQSRDSYVGSGQS